MMFAESVRQITSRVRQLGGRRSTQTQLDRAVARRLYATFERELELADVHGVQFYVRGGTVTIYGTIKNSLDADLIMSLVRQVPGVKGVRTNLQVIDPWFLGESSSSEAAA